MTKLLDPNLIIIFTARDFIAKEDAHSVARLMHLVDPITRMRIWDECQQTVKFLFNIHPLINKLMVETASCQNMTKEEYKIFNDWMHQPIEQMRATKAEIDTSYVEWNSHKEKLNALCEEYLGNMRKLQRLVVSTGVTIDAR